MSDELLEFSDSPANDVAMSIRDDDEPFVEPEMGKKNCATLQRTSSA